MPRSEKLRRAIELIDAANAKDPRAEIVDGENRPKELVYAQRMSARLESFNTQASEHLQLACRAQHIERWKTPRSDYPAGRSGYLKWRLALRRFHAQRATELMAQADYSHPDMARVNALILKRDLHKDSESQTLEDVACLVFLEYYLGEFSKKHSEDKLTDIIAKTWQKMSCKARSAATGLSFEPSLERVIKRAIANPDSAA